MSRLAATARAAPTAPRASALPATTEAVGTGVA